MTRGAALLALLTAAACVTGTPRPVRPAVEFEVETSPVTAIAAVVGAVADQGLPLRSHDDAMGVVETDFVDIGLYNSTARVLPLAERLVRFRISVVPAETGYGSQVRIEARYAPFMTGGQIERRRERAIPRDHPAMELVATLQEAITERSAS